MATHNRSNTLIAGLKACNSVICNSASGGSIVLYCTLLRRLLLHTTRMITAVTPTTQHKKHAQYRADRNTLYKTLLRRLLESFSASLQQQTGPTRTAHKVHSLTFGWIFTLHISCQRCVRTKLKKLRWQPYGFAFHFLRSRFGPKQTLRLVEPQ